MRYINEQVSSCALCPYSRNTMYVINGGYTAKMRCILMDGMGILTSYPEIPEGCPLPKEPKK